MTGCNLSAELQLGGVMLRRDHHNRTVLQVVHITIGCTNLMG